MTCLGHKSFLCLFGDAADIAVVEVAHGPQGYRNGKAGVECLRATKRLGKIDPVAEQTIEIKVVFGLAAYPDDFEFLNGEIEGRSQTNQVIFADGRIADAAESKSAEKGKLHFPVRRWNEDR